MAGSVVPRGVVAAVRLHVPAKRYLCAVEEAYLAGLSPPSLTSLALQGARCRRPRWLISNGFHALPMRSASGGWDDQAKVSGLPTLPFEHFKRHFDALR